jgi:hypothetical protein
VSTEGYEICREHGHYGSVWSHRLLAYLCPHDHDDGRLRYAKSYEKW